MCSREGKNSSELRERILVKKEKKEEENGLERIRDV